MVKTYKRYLNNYLIFFIIINIIPIIINDTELEDLNLDYTHALTLMNGNIFILYKNGVIVYSHNLTTILHRNDFGGTELISSEKENNFTSIIQCYEGNQYIFALIYDKIYIFSSRGLYIFHKSITLLSDFSTKLQYIYYTFIYYKYEDSIYYFISAFRNNEDFVKFVKFEINIDEESFNINKEIFYNISDILSDSITCQITDFDNYTNILSCFYLVFEDYILTIKLSLFDPENEFVIINETQFTGGYTPKESFLIKSIIGLDKTKIICGLISSSSSTLRWFAFDFNVFQINSVQSTISCSSGTYLFNANYYYYINHYILSCKNDKGITFSIFGDFSDFQSLSTILMAQVNYANCSHFTNYDIIFFLYEGKYNIITNFLCEDKPSQIISFPNYVNFDNYDKPSDGPDSYTFIFNSSFSNIINPIQTTISTTIIKNIPTTIIKPIQTTIPTTIIKNIPTTIVKPIQTTIPTTIIKNIPTSIIKPIQTTIPTTIIKNIPTTIVKPIQTTIPTTIIKNIPTSIIKSIQTTIFTTNIKNIPTSIIKSIQTTIFTTNIKNIPTSIIKPILTSISSSNVKTTQFKTYTTIIEPVQTNLGTTIIKPKNTIISTNTSPTTTLKSIFSTNIFNPLYNANSTTMINNIEQFYSTIIINPITTSNINDITIKTNFITSNISSSTNLIYSSQIISDNNCPLKCLTCNHDSLRLNLCIKCNIYKEYYPSIVKGEVYVECYNQETKPSNYFFNKITKYYESCYRKCKTCENQGNEQINNCTLCKNNYIFRPDQINSSNCVIKCNYYYYISFGEYFCTENKQCPIEVRLLIRNKGRCVDNCKDDNEYIYQFNYECLKECPEDTIPDEDNICKLKDKKKCYLYSDSFLNVNYNDLESNNFNTLIKRYIIGFEDTDFHVDFYQTQNYTITIYKEMYCLKELGMNSTIIDFGECYEKIQKKYNLEGKSLLILISDFFNDKKLVNTLIYFFNPETGEKLPIDEICNEELFIIEKSLKYYPEINISQAKFFEDQNIDIFNTSDVFYNDLCCFFESPNGKDVPLKERILIFYPNVTLCDDSCNNIGVNLTSMKAICGCRLQEILHETHDAAKLTGLDFINILDSLSISVIKCFKTLFQYKYFINCYGGFISLLLIIIQTICVIIAGKISMVKIKKTTFSLVQNNSNLLYSKKILKYPPKKKIKTTMNYNYNLTSKNNKSANMINSSRSQKNLLFTKKKNLIQQLNINKKNSASTFNSNFKIKTLKKNSSLLPLNNEVNLREYLLTSMNDLDFNELKNRDNRSFWRMFLDKLILNQKIIDLIANNNWIIPKSIRVIFLIVMIDLYFVVNALFYNEDYIRDLYYSDEDETFFSFVPRSLNRIIYTFVVNWVLDFIISLLFPSENKIKKIIIRKRNNITEMKNKILISIKNIINNYWIFIIISYLLTVFSWYYMSCFNNVYPYLKIEWIKSSIFIFIVTQLIIISICFLFSLLRFISIKCKSERLYRISNYFFS